MQKKAFIFDLNGTMIDDMKYHTTAWHEMLTKELSADLTWEQVKMQMYGKNEEVLIRVFGEGRFSDEEIKELSFRKENRYRLSFKPYMQLIKGLQHFLDKAQLYGIKMGIGSAAIIHNVDFILDGLNIRHYFSSIVCADNVIISKPDPESFLKAANELGVTPDNCIVFEDAPKGVEAALNAGMQSIVLLTTHNREEFNAYPNILFFINDYTEPALEQLFNKKEAWSVN
jgi:beta-phosphoglucomutase family hydrolase